MAATSRSAARTIRRWSQASRAASQNLFVIGGSSPLLVDPSPIAGGTPQQATFDGASSDLSTVVFDEQAQLTADAPGPPEGGSQPDVLYASTPSATANPTVKLATVLPDGTPVDGTLAGAGASSPAGSQGGAFGAISADGSKIFFTATPTGSSTTNLYVRENPMSSSASTTQVDTGIGGGGVFLAATSDGSNVYFMDGAGNNLYDYNTTTNHLTDLTPGGSAGIDGLAGLNSTGSGLYFVANSVLASNSNSFGQAATDGQPNLYLLPNGDPTKTTFIATLSGNDSSDWSESLDVPGLGQWLVHRVHDHERPEHERPDEQRPARDLRVQFGHGQAELRLVRAGWLGSVRRRRDRYSAHPGRLR